MRNAVLVILSLLSSLLLLSLPGCSKSGATTAVPTPQGQQSDTTTAQTQQSVTASCKHPVTTKGISVVCVVDGDTLRLADGTLVRLIGMDAPEKGEYGYENATLLLASLLDKSYVHMEKDVSDTDRFGRQLRYVYATDYLLNQYVVEEGWARAADYPPDTAKSLVLHSAEQSAKSGNLGIWG